MIVGDYHHAFIASKKVRGKTRKLLVPGCVGRQAIDMEDYECKVWICEIHEDGRMDFEPKPLKPLWELERVEEGKRASSLLDCFVSLNATAFDYKDRVRAAENLQPLTERQRNLVCEIIQRSET
jgi:hypothetical protein